MNRKISFLPSARCAELGIECLKVCVPLHNQESQETGQLQVSEKECMLNCQRTVLDAMHYNCWAFKL